VKKPMKKGQNSKKGQGGQGESENGFQAKSTHWREPMRFRQGKKRKKADWLQIDWGWVLAFWPQFQSAKTPKGRFSEGEKKQKREKRV
jgi:hypothetical protein